MKKTLRRFSTLLTVSALVSVLFVSNSIAAAPDDGYPPGEAAPGRTCMADAVGQKTTSSYSGKVLACIVIQGVSRWWIEGDPLPAVETTAPAPAGPKAPAPAISSDSFLWDKV